MKLPFKRKPKLNMAASLVDILKATAENAPQFPSTLKIAHEVTYKPRPRPTKIWAVWQDPMGRRWQGRPESIGTGAYRARLDLPGQCWYLKTWDANGVESMVQMNWIEVEFDYGA